MIKKSMIIAFVITATLFLHAQDSMAGSVSIKGATKIYRMGSYVISINYETRDKWTDSLLFKVHCKFEKGEFTFASGSLNSIERGWHKIEMPISKVTKKRYGSLREYKISLYEKGVLVDTRKSY